MLAQALADPPDELAAHAARARCATRGTPAPRALDRGVDLRRRRPPRTRASALPSIGERARSASRRRPSRHRGRCRQPRASAHRCRVSVRATCQRRFPAAIVERLQRPPWRDRIRRTTLLLKRVASAIVVLAEAVREELVQVDLLLPHEAAPRQACPATCRSSTAQMPAAVVIWIALQFSSPIVAGGRSCARRSSATSCPSRQPGDRAEHRPPRPGASPAPRVSRMSLSSVAALAQPQLVDQEAPSGRDGPSSGPSCSSARGPGRRASRTACPGRREVLNASYRTPSSEKCSSPSSGSTSIALAVVDRFARVAVFVDQAVGGPGEVVLQLVRSETAAARRRACAPRRACRTRRVRSCGDDRDEARRQAALRHEDLPVGRACCGDSRTRRVVATSSVRSK